MAKKKQADEEVEQVSSLAELEEKAGLEPEGQEEESKPVQVHVGPIGSKQDAKKKENMVEIDLPFRIQINGKWHQGKMIVPEHEAQSIVPMIQAKLRTDAEIMVGRSYLTQKLADGRLVVKQQG